jgi:putative ABC transport system permease protein
MKLRDLLKTAFGNLTRHKARTALTTIGVVVGILTIVTMVSLGVGVQREMGEAFGSVGLETLSLYPVTEDAGGFDPFGQPQRTRLLTPELVAQLQARDDVVEVIPFLRMPNSVRVNLRLEGDEVQARPWGPRPSSIPEPF